MLALFSFVFRLCEERSDEAIHDRAITGQRWIASLCPQ
jgi:hypothetical protein